MFSRNFTIILFLLVISFRICFHTGKIIVVKLMILKEIFWSYNQSESGLIWTHTLTRTTLKGLIIYSWSSFSSSSISLSSLKTPSSLPVASSSSDSHSSAAAALIFYPPQQVQVLMGKGKGWRVWQLGGFWYPWQVCSVHQGYWYSCESIHDEFDVTCLCHSNATFSIVINQV